MRPGEIVIAFILVGLGGLFFWESSKSERSRQEMLRQLSRPPPVAQPVTASSATPAQSEPTLEESALHLSRAGVPQIRATAIQILSLLGGEKTEARLLEIIKEDPVARPAALQALRSMGSRKVGGIVLDWLKNGSSAERQAAANALPGQLTPEMLTDVLGLLRDLPGGAEYSAVQVRQCLYAALQQLGDRRACDPLFLAMRQETQDGSKRAAAAALAACASRRELPLLGKALASLGPCNPNTDLGTHSVLIESLGNAHDLRATEYLLPLLAAGSNPQVQRQVVQALTQLRDPLAATALCAMDVKDPALKRNIEEMLRNAAYPGIRVVDDKFVPVPEGEMRKLLDERARQIAELEKSLAETAELPGGAAAAPRP